jgi:hypothetical protein
MVPPTMDHISLGVRVPTILISPYSRSGYVDHHVMNFTSILKFVESDYRLPALNARDRSAPSLLSSLDFTQTPLPPLVQAPRTCPAGDLHIQTTLSGRILQLSSTQPSVEMRMRVKSGDIATLLLLGNTPVLMTTGKATLADLRPDDHVFVSARPDPTHALLYGVNWISDADLSPFINQQGVIINANPERIADYGLSPEGRSYTMRFGNRTMLVDLDSGTRITLANGKQTGMNALRAGMQIRISGVHNTRLDEITTTSTLHVLKSGRAASPSTPTTLSGTILKLSLAKNAVLVHVRVKNGDVTTVRLPPRTPIWMTGGRASLADLRPDARVTASVRPDRNARLIYTANWIKDTDLAPFKNQTGVIFAVGQEHTADLNASKEGRSYTMRFGKRSMLVDVDPGTRITLTHGKRGSLAALQPGVHVQLTGVHDVRLDEITSTSSVRIL